jgi:hypothetical protein
MDDGKVKLHLAKPTPAALAELYKRLTGKRLSAEGLKRLREMTREETMNCEICGTTEDIRSMQTTRPAPAQMLISGTDDARATVVLTAREAQPMKRRSTAGPRDCCLVSPETAHEHGHEDNDGIPGTDDARAAAALRARAIGNL